MNLWNFIKNRSSTLLAKLVLSFLAFCCLSTLILFYIIEYSFESGLLTYINKREQAQIAILVEKLEELYPDSNDWQTVRDSRRSWKRLLDITIFGHHFKKDIHHRDERPPHERDERHDRPPRRPPPGAFFTRIRLFDTDHNLIAGPPLPPGKKIDEYKIEYAGETVAWLVVEPARLLLGDIELDFKTQFKKWLVLSMLLLFLLSSLLAWLITKNFLTPVKRLTQGTETLSQGNYGQQLLADRNDELGQLVTGFNRLSLVLKESQTARERWMADIAHELRTPLTILQGEIQALLDGTREIKAEALSSLMEEVKTLTRLVNDLRDLTLSDIGGMSYRFQQCDINDIIQTVIESFQSRMDQQQLSLQSDGLESKTLMTGDYDRLVQLFNNIFSNSIRYTDKGGQIRVSLSQDDNQLSCVIEDSSPGVEKTHLTRIFDRLYRVDASRNRTRGGSGLGLSIARNIVKAHQGDITAEHSTLGGLKIIINIPVNQV